MDRWGIGDSLLKEAVLAEKAIEPEISAIEKRAAENSLKVLAGFRDAEIGEHHLQGSHGYGYHDSGREALERLFAKIFGGEEAIVRPQLVSGTHALACALFGLLRPGDEVITIPSVPYDTLHPIFGLRSSTGSLPEWKIGVRGVELADVLAGKPVCKPETRVVFIQRSRGYAWKDAIPLGDIETCIKRLKAQSPKLLAVVDNCYGEFVKEREPCDIGADLAAGSLIKNPGGGMALTGAYLVGRSECIRQAAIEMTAPGLGKEIGPTLGLHRSFFLGLYLAPQLVGEAMKTALFASQLFHQLGYEVSPAPKQSRTDIIQGIKFGSREKLLAFAKGIQAAGPLNHKTVPIPAPMTGYEHEVVMAGGTFVQGGSLELSCDAPLRPPYVAYLQGGLSFTHGKLGVLLGAQVLLNAPKAL